MSLEAQAPINLAITSPIGRLPSAIGYPVHPREVFADAITDRASGIILAHNHPEGGVEPSEADADVTRRIKQAGEIVGIHLLDHIIFNSTTYFSFLEAGRL